MRLWVWRTWLGLLVFALLVACGQTQQTSTSAGSGQAQPGITPAATEPAQPNVTPAATEPAQPDITPAATESMQPDVTPAATEPPTSSTGGGAAVSHGGPVKDHVSLIDALRGKGWTVEPVGAVEQPFLQGMGTTLRISGGELQQPAELQSFEYDDLAVAASDAEQIDPDGNPRTTMITWIAPPHFFRKEQVIVIYLGTDAAVLDALTELLGPQFAGR